LDMGLTGMPIGKSRGKCAASMSGSELLGKDSLEQKQRNKVMSHYVDTTAMSTSLFLSQSVIE
jgi:hypothetical protein